MKNLNNNNMYTFKLLREEAVDTDAFEDNTHEKIADSLSKLIQSEEKGISIGLEGSWGTGKSTVVSILRRKLKENDSSVLLIQFDAWAHEGDPLRRIFLESLIDEINSKVEVGANLSDLKEKIAHRQKTTKIKTTRTTTVLGKWLSITIFIVPIGVVFLSRFSSFWSFLFIVGLLLSGAPLLVIIFNFIRILWNKYLKKEKNSSSTNWSFLQDETYKDITQEVSEEDERSSIEFERYFNKIMELVFKDSKIEKIIIVVDDLDRIDKYDSLKIWSTLQTFLQQRNQTWTKKEWFDNIWIIVPYDPDGLSRLWDKDDNNSKQDTAKSFFDKCFQLRLEVPKPIFSAWDKFARDMIDQALGSWAQIEKDELIRILRIIRERIDDVPTPREIKNYINQVGFLASRWGNAMPISSIAYYVCWRELKNESVNNIKEKLVNNELQDLKHKTLLPESCVKDLAGLVFGVAPEKGVQLLLEPILSAALQNEHEKKLDELYQIHGERFWPILNYHFEHSDFNLDYALNAAKAIYESIWEKHKKKCGVFINRAVRIDCAAISKHDNWSEFTTDKYLALINICSQSNHNSFMKRLYGQIANRFRNVLNENENVNWENVVRSLSKIMELLELKLGNDFPTEKTTINELTLPKLVSLVQASDVISTELFKWFAPQESIIEEIKNIIEASKPLQDELFQAIQYTLNAGINSGWNTVLTQCQQYIDWNSGNYSNQSDDIFKIINAIVFNISKLESIPQIIRNIVESGPYHNLLWHRRNQNLVYAALLCGFIFKKDLHSKAIPGVGNSLNGINEIRNFWANSNLDNAKKVFVEIKKYNSWTFLWELATDEQNKLVKDIITMVLDDEDVVDLFRVNAGLDKLKDFSNLFEDEDNKEEKITKLIEKFRKLSDLGKEIIDTEDIDIIGYNYELHLIIKQTMNNEVITKIADKLKNVDKDNWINALRDDTYLTSLAIEIKNKINAFYLENNFTDAFIEFANREQDNNYEDWQKEHWQELISLMDSSFKKHYREKITDFLCKNIQSISLEAFNLNKEHFIYQNIFKETKSLQNALDKFVKSKNIEQLEFLNEILSKDTKNKFKPEKHFSDVMKQPLSDLCVEQDDEKNKTVIVQLAKKFQVSLVGNSKGTSIENDKE